MFILLQDSWLEMERILVMRSNVSIINAHVYNQNLSVRLDVNVQKIETIQLYRGNVRAFII